MPVHECEEGGKPGYQWGDQKCYTYTAGDEAGRKKAKQAAYIQGSAVEHESGTEKADEGEPANENSRYDRFIDDGEGLEISDPEESEDTKKAAFTEPFPEGKPVVLQGEQLLRALRLDIASEHDAAALYLAHADVVADLKVKSTLVSIAREEIIHVGEFQKLIDMLTGGSDTATMAEGAAEVTGECCQKSVYSPIRKVDEALHWVTGVVLEPDTVDLQGDVISAEDIRKAMEGFMLKSQAIGHQHKALAKASVVECYRAPFDFMLDGRELIRKNSWVLTVKVLDETLWHDVVSGKITGFSIGGSGVRKPA